MEPTKVKRGDLTFERAGEQESNIRCRLGDPSSPESEHMFEFHESFIDDVIAGLKAMKRQGRSA